MVLSRTAIPGSAAVTSRMGFDRMDQAYLNEMLTKSCSIHRLRKGQYKNLLLN